MFVLVVGGGKVGYYLAKELIDSGHEVALMEKDPTRARQITDEIGSIVIPHDGCEGKYLGEAGCNRADVVAAVTGDDEDNLVICQMAKHHFDVPRTIARVNNPKNEPLFRHLGVDELVSPTRMILGSIEQDIPVHELLHLAALGEGELEIIEAHLQPGRRPSGARRASWTCRRAVRCSRSSATAKAIPLRPDSVLREGDKVIAIGKQECEDLLHGQLIGDPEAVDRRLTRADGRGWPGRRVAPPGISIPKIGRTLDNGVVNVLAFVHGISPTGSRSGASRLRHQRGGHARQRPSSNPSHLRGRGAALSGADADQHPPVFRERHPADPVDPSPDPRARGQPRRDPHPVRARGAPRRSHPGGALRRRDRGRRGDPSSEAQPAAAPASPTPIDRSAANGE